MKKALLILLIGVSSISVANTRTISALEACYLAGYYVEKGESVLADFWRQRIKDGPYWDGRSLSRQCVDSFNKGVSQANREGYYLN